MRKILTSLSLKALNTPPSTYLPEFHHKTTTITSNRAASLKDDHDISVNNSNWNSWQIF